MDVTDVLRDRMQEPGGSSGWRLVSLLVHAALVALILLSPVRWLSQHRRGAAER